MRSCVVLESTAELPRTGFETGRALGHKMFQVAKSLIGEDMPDASHAESTTGSALRQQPRTEARMWEQEGKDTFHDANLCAHPRVLVAHLGTERDLGSERESH